MRKLQLVIVFTVCILRLLGDDCVGTIRQYYNKSNNLNNYENKTCSITYEHTVVYSDKQLPPTKSKYTMVICGKYVTMKGNYFDMYKDDKNTFIITHVDRNIYWTVTKSISTNEQILNSVTGLQDTLLAYMKSTGCGIRKNTKGEDVKYVNVQLGKGNAAMKISYVFNVDEDKLLETQITYLGAGPLKQITTKLVDYKVEDFSSKISAYAQIFDSGQKLKRKFAGYKLNDSRKGKKTFH